MPATKVIKPKSAEASRKPGDEPSAAEIRAARGADRELRVRAVRKSRASSCPRGPQQPRGRCDRAPASRASCEGRTRSTSAAPKAAAHRTQTNPDHRRKPAGNQPRRPGEQRSVRPESPSHRAFTVIPPDPRRRRDMQRKAEAELAALEELRLSRAMVYVSINPSSVDEETGDGANSRPDELSVSCRPQF
ncbi:uncharacterized protein [Paralichthys olivaceus]|uniref:uncharacterized protein isoform X2 n=1 Tax=Paralichthys olivaceus TaxID=8255 RepID=UPI003752B8E2